MPSQPIVRMGVDPGSRRIGLALSEPDTGMAYPHKTLHVQRGQDVGAQIVAEAEAHAVAEIVVGLPLSLRGHEGDAARRARELAEQIRARGRIPVMLWDERLSSVAAERALRQTGLGGRARRGVVDQVAATLLLQSYLDANTEREWTEDDLPQPQPPKSPPRRRRGPGAGSRT